MSQIGEDTGGALAAEVTCALCQTSVAANVTKLANGHRVCPACALQLERELAQGRAGSDDLPRAALMGALGALLGAAVWAAVVVLTNLEIGYLAVLVGFLAGYGVKLGARGGHGKRLQQTAVACAVAGLLATKYFVFAHFFVSGAAKEGVALSYLSPTTLSAFPHFLGEMLSPFDALWLLIALSSAWRVPRAPHVVVRS
jgi:hypothetical protein